MGKLIDLTGQRFGKLTVLNKLPFRNKKTYWKCQCDCGKIKEVRGDHLRGGYIKSCGDCEKDLTNKTFGLLQVIKKGKKDYYGHQFYICKCECGNIIEVNGDHLRRGFTKSCGCLRGVHEGQKFNLVGKTFGLWTVLSLKTVKNHSYWKCKCRCGTERIIRGSSLVQGQSNSCGCEKYSKGENKISSLLKINNISFAPQYIFNNCISPKGYSLFFDFYVNNQYIIEYDGEQHFKSVEYFGGNEEYQKRIIYDEIKNQWCKENNIPLIRIPYWYLQDLTIDDLKLETSQFIVK